MSPRVIRMAVVFILAVGVGTYVKMARKNDAGKVALASANEVLVRVEGYEANRKFYDMHTDLAHQAAMNEAYTIGGRRARDTFDEAKYMSVFFGRLMSQARDEGKPDLVRSLKERCDEENIQPDTN